ncbi:hypothetical protein Tsubulata_031017 [Turnera subulata]|uniref:aspartyl aminopeptidase n=1 Tax=Turnera subulata TaxID=218843 RepID=A0A9Q0FHU2_9ROSI|nr:hypothetical protein Tsubulata_031017 [Turnera subulata]
MSGMSIARLQLLHSSPPIITRPSLFPFKRLPLSLPTRLINRKFSTTTTTRCSTSHHNTQNPESNGGSIVGDLLDYLNESWTQQLLAAGFHLLSETDEWDLKPGGRYFFTRNMSCLVAFAIGEKYGIGNGFHAIAAHTDSPCLKLKPKSASSKSSYLMVNVQTYGGGLWHTWFDRDLSVAGRVIVRGNNGSFQHKLVKVKKPLLRIPTLAIHLDRLTLSHYLQQNQKKRP